MAKTFLKYRWLAIFAVAYGLFPYVVFAESSSREVNLNAKASINYCNNRVKSYSAQSECRLLSIPRSYCDSEEVHRPFNTANNSDTFSQFVSQFYCAIKTENKTKYAERIRFPIQFAIYGRFTESGTGAEFVTYKKSQFYGERILLRGGDDLVFSYAVDGFDGFFTLKAKNKDISRLWRFKLIDDKWTLIIVESEVY